MEAWRIVDLTKVNVALPSIEEALGAGSTELQLLVAGFVLTFGLTLVPAGRLGDQGSRKVMFLIGLSLFTLTSLVCALAPTTGVLLVGRLLQGVAAGIQMPQVLGLVQQLFQGAERGAAFGLFGATIGIATAFGPTEIRTAGSSPAAVTARASERMERTTRTPRTSPYDRQPGAVRPSP